MEMLQPPEAQPAAIEPAQLSTETRKPSDAELAFYFALKRGDPNLMADAALTHMIDSGDLKLPPEDGNRAQRRANKRLRERQTKDAKRALYKHFVRQLKTEKVAA